MTGAIHSFFSHCSVHCLAVVITGNLPVSNIPQTQHAAEVKTNGSNNLHQVSKTHNWCLQYPMTTQAAETLPFSPVSGDSVVTDPSFVSTVSTFVSDLPLLWRPSVFQERRQQESVKASQSKANSTSFEIFLITDPRSYSWDVTGGSFAGCCR